jgi:mannan endo-1,4-beta-mannosidase
MSDFVRTSGVQFTDGGKPMLLSGANTYYLCYKSRRMVDAALDAAVRLQCSVVRTWAFLDAGRLPDGEKDGVCFQYQDVNGAVTVRDGDNGLNRLDYVVHAAKARGLRLILPLVNNWTDFGGMARYLEWFGLRFHDEFYTSPDARDRYKLWAETLLQRVNTITGIAYREEPAIAAWELANEPRLKGSEQGKPSSGQIRRNVILDWAAEMSGWLRKHDPNHLIAVGDEGFYARGSSRGQLYDGSHGTDFDAFLALPDVDFGTYHMYPEHWNNANWGEEWIDQHLESGSVAGKPVLLEEYGLQNAALRNRRYASWLDRINASGGGALVWMLAAEQDDGTPYPDYDRYTIYDELDAAPVRAFSKLLKRPSRDTGAVLLSLVTSEGMPIRDESVEVRFKPQQGSSVDRVLNATLDGEPLFIGLPIVGSPPSRYTVSVTPSNYRFGGLGLIAVPQAGITVLAKPVARDPERWRVHFDAWTTLRPRFDALKDVLGNSPDLRYLRSSDPGRLCSGDAWDEFGHGLGSLPKTCLLNVYHRLSTLREPIGKRTWWSLLDVLLEAGRERIIAMTPVETAEVIRAISENIVEYSNEYRTAEHAERHRGNFPARFQPAIARIHSVKTVESEGNVQLTAAFLRNENFALLDIDIDENGAALRHWFDVLRPEFTGGTHPFDIHELLQQAASRAHVRIDLGYELQLVEG